MLAHAQGGMLNAAQPGPRAWGWTARPPARYLDLLVGPAAGPPAAPWHANAGKRLVKSPKVYLRDSGLLHALLGIRDLDALLAHPVVGASWEGFVIENLLAVAPEGAEGYFYRTGGGAEIDLVLELPGGERWAVEIKRSLTPQPGRGFHSACADLSPHRRFVVYPGRERFPLAAELEALSLRELAAELNGERR